MKTYNQYVLFRILKQTDVPLFDHFWTFLSISFHFFGLVWHWDCLMVVFIYFLELLSWCSLYQEKIRYHTILENSITSCLSIFASDMWGTVRYRDTFQFWHNPTTYVRSNNQILKIQRCASFGIFLFVRWYSFFIFLKITEVSQTAAIEFLFSSRQIVQIDS